MNLIPHTRWARNHLSIVLCAFAMLGALAGCGDKDWGYVNGTITLQGKPVGPGALMFEPESPASVTTPSAIARFDEDGKYALKSAGNRKGAPTGTYLVMIQGLGDEEFGAESIGPKRKSDIPPKYMNPRATGLKAKVERGTQTINFDLIP